ncbi:MAG: hypothetical protein LUE24_13295 [Lachnospiraceae bacterium]|nr:hypothetical protein [Lachnospiraceae bacterium]
MENTSRKKRDWKLHGRYAMTSSKQAPYRSLPRKRESSFATLLLLSHRSNPASVGTQDGRAGNTSFEMPDCNRHSDDTTQG